MSKSMKQKGLHRQKLLPAIITSVFYSTSVYAANLTDTINVSDDQTVTLSSGDSVSVVDKNAIEVTDGRANLIMDGASVSVSGTDTNSAGILIDQILAGASDSIEITNSQISNQSGWGIILEENNYRDFQVSGANTVIQGGAGAIKIKEGASISMNLEDQAQLIGNIDVQENASLSLGALDGAKITGDIYSADFSSTSVSLNNQAELQGSIELKENSYGSVYMNQNTKWNGNLTSKSGSLNIHMSDDSIWTGDLDISQTDDFYSSHSLYINADNNSHRYGQTNIESISNSHNNFSVTQDSSWNGDINIDDLGTYSHYYFSTAENSIWNGNINLNLKTSSSPSGSTSTVNSTISIYGHSKFFGDFNIISDNDFLHYGSVGMQISDNSHFIGNYSAKGTFSTHNYISSNSSWVGDADINFVENENGQGYFSAYIHDHSLREGNTTIYANDGHVNINVYDHSEWRGDIEITGASEDQYAKVITLEQNSILTGAVKADTSSLTIADNSRWNLTGNSALENLEVSSDLAIHFTDAPQNRAGGFHNLTVNNLKSDSTSNIHMRTDLAALTGDFINITNSVDGNFAIHVNNQGSAHVNPYKELTIIESNGYQDNFHLANQVEVGGYLYNMRADGTKLNLFTTGRPTTSAEASVNAMGAGYLMRYAENQTLLQRMGDLRQDERVSNDVWTRAYSGEFNVADGDFLSGYDLDYSGVQIGADRQFNLASGKAYLGAMAGFSKGKQKHHQGSGTIDSSSIGVYGTYVHNNGIYVDTLLRYVHMNHDYDVSDSVGSRVNGNGSTDGYAASLSLGKRFYLQQPTEGWYLEPEAQISTSYQNGTTITSSNGLRTDVDGYQSTQAQAGLRFGHEFNSTNKPFNVYVKAAYVQELDGKVDFRLNNLGEKEQFGGNWWTLGAGVTTTLNKQHNLYFDVERSDGASFKHPWQVNLGYRFSF